MQSMTGYGKASTERDGRFVEVELSSLNSNHLEVNLSLDDVPELRERIQDRLRESFERGQIQVSIRGDVLGEELRAPALNEDSVSFYLKQIRSLREESPETVGKADPVRLLELPGVLSVDLETRLNEEARPLVLEALDRAVDELVSMRKQEGKAIARDLEERTEIIRDRLDSIEDRVPDSLRQHRERYRKRVDEVAGLTPDELKERVESEMQIYAEKSDIAEEVTRLHSHLDQIRETLGVSGAVGKKLKFLFQELLREINTVGAKANDAEISQLAVDVKSEIEKCREQVRNLE